jgi:hypothetical protein
MELLLSRARRKLMKIRKMGGTAWIPEKNPLEIYEV